jgi:hypothetical protein
MLEPFYFLHTHEKERYPRSANCQAEVSWSMCWSDAKAKISASESVFCVRICVRRLGGALRGR